MYVCIYLYSVCAQTAYLTHACASACRHVINLHTNAMILTYTYTRRHCHTQHQLTVFKNQLPARSVPCLPLSSSLVKSFRGISLSFAPASSRLASSMAFSNASHGLSGSRLMFSSIVRMPCGFFFLCFLASSSAALFLLASSSSALSSLYSARRKTPSKPAQPQCERRSYAFCTRAYPYRNRHMRVVSIMSKSVFDIILTTHARTEIMLRAHERRCLLYACHMRGYLHAPTHTHTTRTYLNIHIRKFALMHSYVSVCMYLCISCIQS
jgi:hypothetical protein